MIFGEESGGSANVTACARCRSAATSSPRAAWTAWGRGRGRAGPRRRGAAAPVFAGRPPEAGRTSIGKIEIDQNIDKKTTHVIKNSETVRLFATSPLKNPT